MLQAIYRDPLMRVSVGSAEDVHVLHDALARLREYKRGEHTEPLTLHLKNCGTALRFLQVHLERCYAGEPITLTGDQRLIERMGAPTTQTTSARILHGDAVPYSADESPYITMSRKVLEAYKHLPRSAEPAELIEADWSAAAFWYEYVAIHGGELLLKGLTDRSLQGDRIVADIYATHFGVQTTFTPAGAHIFQSSNLQILQSSNKSSVSLDFHNCPDLYPAVALTAERLGIALQATGTERLAYKESDRLEAVARHETRHDHRMAMALLAADYPADDTDCIAKSYPAFLSELARVKGCEACVS